MSLSRPIMGTAMITMVAGLLDTSNAFAGITFGVVLGPPNASYRQSSSASLTARCGGQSARCG